MHAEGAELPVADVECWLAPATPTKIVATHLTYRSRAEEYPARRRYAGAVARRYVARRAAILSRVFPDVIDAPEIDDAIERLYPVRTGDAGRDYAVRLATWLHRTPEDAAVATLDRLGLHKWLGYPLRRRVLETLAHFADPIVTDAQLRHLAHAHGVRGEVDGGEIRGGRHRQPADEGGSGVGPARHEIAFASAHGAAFAVHRAEALTREWIAVRRQHFAVVFRQVAGALVLQAVASAVLLGVGGGLVLARQLTLGQLVAAELIVSAVVTGFSPDSTLKSIRQRDFATRSICSDLASHLGVGRGRRFRVPPRRARPSSRTGSARRRPRRSRSRARRARAS